MEKFMFFHFDGKELYESTLLSRQVPISNVRIDSNPDFIIVFLWPKDLINPYTLRCFFECLYKKSIIEDNTKYKPIIITSVFNSNINTELNLSEENNSITDIVKELTNKHPFTTSIFNPNIWIRFVELGELTNQLPNILEEFIYYDQERLFFQNNAKEYLEFFLRIQKENWLDKETSGHSSHIYPFIYSNERSIREKTKINDELDLLYTNEKDVYTGGYKVRGVTLRILLIDDKIGSQRDCKALLIKNLLELKFDPQKRKDVCWLTPNKDETDSVIIKIIESYIDDSEQGVDNTHEKIKELDENKIQIIAVKSLSVACQLLGDNKIRFDLILMDYLLKEKNALKEREKATEFWGDGIEKYFEFSANARNIEKYQSYIENYRNIKDNRGPLHKLWIFPITAFNQTFIDDLRNRGVRLIDYYWNLSRGADPINTPYLFIYSLNKFLQLQLEDAFFSKDEIIGFLKKSITKVKNINKFDYFSAYMGSEYTVFVEKYMSRPVIYRDKELSLFAAYMWGNFYSKKDLVSLFKLVQHIHKFYHRCAFGTQADFDKMVLYWRELKIFIENEGKSLDINDVDEFINVFKRIEPKP